MLNIELADVCERSLKETVGDETFEYIEGIVKLALFSNFPRRRRWAANRLPNAFYNTKVKIQTINSDGIVYAYLKFEGTNKYMFIGCYRKNLRLIELTPEETEITQWPI